MHMACLLLLLCAVFGAMEAALVGGYKLIIDPKDQFFQNALAFVRQTYPQVADWEVIEVQQQVVSGVNYAITLSNGAGANANAQVYVPFSGQITIRQFTTSGVQQIQEVTPEELIPLGRVTPTNDTNWPQYRWALHNLYQNHPQTQDMQILSVEYQVVQGINYKFTLQSPTNTIYQYLVFIPLDADLTPFYNQQTSQPLIDLYNMDTNTTRVFLRSHWQTINGTVGPLDMPEENETVLDLRFLPSSSSQQYIAIYPSLVQGLVKVIQYDLSSDPPTKEQVQIARGIHYEAAKVEAALHQCLIDRPELATFSLLELGDLWLEMGLKLTFKKGEETVKATLANIDALEQIIFNDL